MKNLPETLTLAVAEARKAAATTATSSTALQSLDLTSLNDNDTPAAIDALIAKADHGKLGHVAALCVYPGFLTQAFNGTAGKGIGLATVINFPSGKGTLEQTERDIEKSIASGASEIDIVIDYQSFLAGDKKTAEDLLRTCRAACGPDVKMKVILETAEFSNYADLYAASSLALDCGTDFLKTSTGKSKAGGATLEAAAVMMQAITDHKSKAGIKISGGVKTETDCAQYISLVENTMGKGWISFDTFRIGASGVLTNLLQFLGKTDVKGPASPTAY